jgi:NADPH:quinone reductase-like Zn-dependent oxidoreductase
MMQADFQESWITMHHFDGTASCQQLFSDRSIFADCLRPVRMRRAIESVQLASVVVPQPFPLSLTEVFMKAIRIHQFGGADTLVLEDVPPTAIGEDQVLVRVHDAGVNPIDWKIRQGYLRDLMPSNFPMTVGQDFAGEVVETGSSAKQYKAGDRVFGFAQGTYAEFTAAPISTISKMPESINFATAAALPTAGSTALQIMRDVVGARKGMVVLIQGAAGGVGSLASQIGKHLGARVIGTATGADIEYLKSIGVTDVIDFSHEKFEDRVKDVDAVVDLVGGDTLRRSYGVVKRGGVLATTVQPVDEVAANPAGVRAVQVIMKRKAEDLSELATLVNQGALKPRVGITMNLADAKDAQELSQAGKTHGKVILKVA